MRIQSSIMTLLASFFIANAAIAAEVNSFINQELTVENKSQEGIQVTDNAVNELHGDIVPAMTRTGYSYASDVFTVASGQLFSHTIVITNLKNQPICTVTSRLNISTTSEVSEHPMSSNEAKCSTSVYQSFDQNGRVFGFTISVNK